MLCRAISLSVIQKLKKEIEFFEVNIHTFQLLSLAQETWSLFRDSPWLLVTATQHPAIDRMFTLKAYNTHISPFTLLLEQNLTIQIGRKTPTYCLIKPLMNPQNPKLL